MNNTYQVYLISDSTGETLDRIFLALQAQFSNFTYKSHQYSFIRTENQILKTLEKCKKQKNSIILYTIVDIKLAKFLGKKSEEFKIPCFGVLGDLILRFSKLLHQQATHIPSGQHVLDEDYYKRIEAIQFTMNHDDGKETKDIEKSDIVLLGVSRTSKTPTSIYLANRGYKTSNIPIISEKSLPKKIIENPKLTCVIGLLSEASRLIDIRKNRIAILKEKDVSTYTDLDTIENEIKIAKNLYRKFGWPTIDVTRKSVEETAASVIKIYDIMHSQ
ncbi:MAG: kinase/pyrophosphorylase [Candidatus Pelagibacterales bacterium]|nr:MAG: kinase/pyrophosphorylase [Pelagibacterales bacterium]